jgi:farnesyl-diphosphate farnesyltransferase
MSSITASEARPLPVDTPAPTAADAAYQLHSLQHVSRTFALTIPQLPEGLRQVVGNAYLLCRIADTIEDDKELPAERKRHFAERFINVVAGHEPAADFAHELAPILSSHTPAAERELIAMTESVIRITHNFNARQRAALERCVRIMAEGMARYQEAETIHGLKDLPDMDRYCYYVAGVVGEMLTELFCDYSPAIDRHRNTMMELAVSFGQGLQMTNILKDIWDDHRRGACWLPRDIFDRYGVDLSHLGTDQDPAAFAQGLETLIGVARGHLANALRYTLLIPPQETGLRRFCLWALGMAVLTLRRIHRQRRHYRSGNEVKISRRSVKATILISNIAVRHDNLLNLLFKLACRGLPAADIHEKIGH